MAKKKPTKKDMETVISSMINHIGFIEDKLNSLDGLFGLYLNWKKESSEFNKFVTEKVKNQSDQIEKKEPGEVK